MEYLLIALVIMMVLSPLAWLKTSPSQARITAFRRRALGLGLNVQLVPPADAPREDKQPTAVRYFLPVARDNTDEAALRSASWMLIRSPRRGWESPWPEWRWFRREAPQALHGPLGDIIPELPDTVDAVSMEPRGAALYVRESGDVAVVDQYFHALRRLLAVVGREHPAV